jgi:RHS repeat-associated protein
LLSVRSAQIPRTTLLKQRLEVGTRYLVDDLNPTGYAQVVEELASGGAVQRQYTYGLQRISENQVVSNTWTPSFYGYDGFGSVRQLTNSAGTITDTYEYDAFGNQIDHTGTTPNNYLSRGEEFDSDLGLYYLRARYYDALTGRFMTRDPFDGYIDIPETLHRYLYVGGDPINWIDPTGWDEEEEGEVDVEISTSKQVEEGLEGFRERVECVLNTASDLLDAVSKPGVGSIASVVVDLSACKAALKKVHAEVGGRLPKSKPGKFGSPQAGDAEKGYRMDPGHPGRAPGDKEAGPSFQLVGLYKWEEG